ncbi:putative phage-related endonuclease [Clostridium punense]|uniref:Phage-related endonuclease n=1 Tax=Clostridium punense TaxID=1054297 RepID=A0ABS4K9I6_9CLOT|nr:MULTISPECIES: hypothetical protein [Clostridium]EQB85827.1 hypothetical protein M918_17375 [Clostridium sp. BL8]MBP2024429.1 putative phage-related endonuclease [Clostridium punense]
MVVQSYEENQNSKELMIKILNYFALKDTIKEIEEEMRLIEDNVIDVFGNGRSKKLGDFVIKLESKTSYKVDDEVLKRKYPEIYKRVCKKEVIRALEIEEEYYGYL